MFMSDDHKGSAPGVDLPEFSEKELAAEELLMAIEAKDSAAMVSALKAFIELCQYSEE